MSNNDNRSRLTGSSWRPSSNPYDTPLERGNNSTSDVGSGGYRHSPQYSANIGGGGGGGSIDPTPNSLYEQTGRVHFSRAEYKPDAMRQQTNREVPNSMQNSLQGSYNPPPSSGAVYHEQFPGASWEDPMTQRSAHQQHQAHHQPQGHYDATESGGASSARLSAALTRHREENRSSLQRYAEIKRNRRSLSPRQRTFRSDGRERSGRDQHYSSSRDDSRGRVTSRERNFNDDSSTMTPMERWESRKERKARERDGRGSSKERIADHVNRREKEKGASSSSLDRDRSLERLGRVSSSSRSDPREPRAVTPIQHTVARDRASRWSPQEDDDISGHPRGQPKERPSRKTGDWGGSHIDTRPDPSGENMTPQGWARETDDDRHSPLYDDDDDSMNSMPIGQASPLSIDPLEDDLSPGQNCRESKYADDLASFTQSITSSVVKKHANMHADYSQIEEGSRSQAPETAVPVHTMPDTPKDDNESVRATEVARASALCSRFTRRGRGQGENAAAKSNSWCIVTTLAAVIVCIIGAGVAIWYIGRLQKVIDIAESTGDVSSDGSIVGGESMPPTMSTYPSPSPTDTPTISPTATKTSQPSTQREADIGQYLSMLSHGKTDNADSPQYKAKSWLLHEDPLNLFLPFDDLISLADGEDYKPSLTARRIIQRYTLATIFYSMGIGEGGVVQGWLLGDECGNGMEGDTGAWEGLDCHEDGAVRTLVLDGANLHGSIPAELGHLSSLSNLIIKNNPSLTGKIPQHIGGKLSQLRQLGLYGNGLSGAVPKNIFRIQHLVYLNLSDNAFSGIVEWAEIAHHQKKLQRLILHNNEFEGSVQFHLLAKLSDLRVLGLSRNSFTGKIDTIGGLSSIEYLYLDENKFDGTLPETIGQLVELKSLNLDDNEIYGPIPHTVGGLTEIEYLSAKGNTISGGIPSHMRLLTKLKSLNLADNALSGNLGDIAHMTKLKNVHLYSNSFTGSLPEDLFSLRDLEVLFLSSNKLTGEIPEEIASAQKRMKGLYLSDNQLIGTVPAEICGLYRTEDLFLDSNKFEGALPWCMGNMANLRRFFAFNNGFSGWIPGDLLDLPHLVDIGLEDNKFTGGMELNCRRGVGSMNIWADCNELAGGCDCCEMCCGDENSC